MLWRKRSIHSRLMSSFTLLSAAMLLVAIGGMLFGILRIEHLSSHGRVLYEIALLALGLLVGCFLVFLPILHRMVTNISAPLGELARVSQVIAMQNDTREYAPSPVKDEVGRLGDALNRMIDSLSDSREQLRALNTHLQTVRENERTRISREIHDELGQQLTAIKLEVARLPNVDTSSIKEMLDETVKSVREISWELRPSVLDTLGLTAAIEWLGEDFQRRMATRCGVSVPDCPPHVDDKTATELFRICQELLTNVARHANASRVDIVFSAGEQLTLEVRDNGAGMPAAGLNAKSLGLLGIRERAHSLGGRVQMQTVPDIEGTLVRVVVPALRPMP